MHRVPATQPYAASHPKSLAARPTDSHNPQHPSAKLGDRSCQQVADSAPDLPPRNPDRDLAAKAKPLAQRLDRARPPSPPRAPQGAKGFSREDASADDDLYEEPVPFAQRLDRPRPPSPPRAPQDAKGFSWEDASADDHLYEEPVLLAKSVTDRPRLPSPPRAPQGAKGFSREGASADDDLYLKAVPLAKSAAWGNNLAKEHKDAAHAQAAPPLPRRTVPASRDSSKPPLPPRALLASRSSPTPEQPSRNHQRPSAVPIARQLAPSASQQAASVSPESKEAAAELPIKIVLKDIYKLDVKGIVRAATRELGDVGTPGGSGTQVSRETREAAGPGLADEFSKFFQKLKEDGEPDLNPCDVAITGGCNLKAKYLFHVVAPEAELSQEKKEELLPYCYSGAIEHADDHYCETLAIPMLGSEFFDEKEDDKAAEIAIDAVSRALTKTTTLKSITLCAEFVSEEKAFMKALKNRIGEIKSLKGKGIVNAANSQLAPARAAAPISPESKKAAAEPPIKAVLEKIHLLKVDGIVSPANSELGDVGTEVGKAIREAAGPRLAKKCLEMMQNFANNPLPPGFVAVTDGCDLKAKYVFHAVEPKADAIQFSQQWKEQCLTHCYCNAIKTAEESGCETLAIPMLGTKIFDDDKAAKIAIDAVSKALTTTKTLKSISLYANSSVEMRAFEQELKNLKGASGEIQSLKGKGIVNAADSQLAAARAAAPISPESKRAGVEPKLDAALQAIQFSDAEVIVNAADHQLSAVGTKLNKAIREAAGPELSTECRNYIMKYGPVKIGNVAVTGGHNLKATYVFHAVPPKADGSPLSQEQLASCYRKVIELADKFGCKTLAVPTLGTDKFGWEFKSAAKIAIDAVREALKKTETLESVMFCCENGQELTIYKDALTSQ